eukprot:COSAG02_NODE_1403_length_12811_cov_8.982536_2_plen_106_part_00
MRICVFAEPELRAGLTEQGVEWVGGVELMDAILAVRESLAGHYFVYDHVVHRSDLAMQGDIRVPLESSNESDGVKAVCEFRVLASPAMLPMLGTKLGRLLGKFAV